MWPVSWNASPYQMPEYNWDHPTSRILIYKRGDGSPVRALAVYALAAHKRDGAHGSAVRDLTAHAWV